MGMIMCNDIPYGDLSVEIHPAIYSTEEREIGVWIDGKPLYERTIDAGEMIADSRGGTKEVETLSGIDRLVLIDGFIQSDLEGQDEVYSRAIHFSDPNTISNTVRVDVSNNVLRVITKAAWANCRIYIVLRYTKLTDTPGSGKWTPSGIPAHHYSTNEQVVGTWIDGSTLYEKTYFYSISSETTQEITTLDSNIVVKETKGIIHNNGNDMTIPWIDASFFYNIYYNASAHKLTAIKKNTGDWTGQAVEITIRYTKTSS